MAETLKKSVVEKLLIQSMPFLTVVYSFPVLDDMAVVQKYTWAIPNRSR
jgi:hypothetical protein